MMNKTKCLKNRDNTFCHTTYIHNTTLTRAKNIYIHKYEQ